MGDKRDASFGWLRERASRGRFPEYNSGESVLLTIKAAADAPPDLEWTDDGGTLSLQFDLDAVDMAVRNAPDEGVTVKLDITRHVAFWLWGNIDRERISEVYAAAAGKASPFLAEVKDAMDKFDRED